MKPTDLAQQREFAEWTMERVDADFSYKIHEWLLGCKWIQKLSLFGAGFGLEHFSKIQLVGLKHLVALAEAA